MYLHIILQNGNKRKIEVKNKNIKINDLKQNIKKNILKNNNDIKLLYKGTELKNKLSDYNDIKNNSDIHILSISNNQDIQQKPIIEDYIISPFSSSLSNSLEKEYDKIDIQYISTCIKKIEEELENIKEFINNID
tara:strand:+ start:1403 stop:1807 length:405 start_codon:yes stop_codon:yes gene_type:complete